MWARAEAPGLFSSMRKDEFEVGAEWAFRPSQSLGTPAQKVRLVFLAKGRAGRVKVRHLAGELEGLEEFVPAVQLRCLWKDWPKVQKDEQREQRLIEYLEETEPLEDVVLDAAEEVFDASREELFIEHRRRGYTRWIEESALKRFAARAGAEGEPWRKLPAFKNRAGIWFIPDLVLVDLALAFAAAEPETVHLHLDVEEQKLLREGYLLDELEAHRRLLRSKPGFAVARQWAGGAKEHRHLHGELKRVGQLLRRAIYDLKACGAERKALSLERALDGE
jgi:hypothetical protein